VECNHCDRTLRVREALAWVGSRRDTMLGLLLEASFRAPTRRYRTGMLPAGMPKKSLMSGHMPVSGIAVSTLSAHCIGEQAAGSVKSPPIHVTSQAEL
jgi:hypothetical protein